jgi:uncharacterized membrane protein
MEQLEEQKYETKEEVKNEEKVVEGKSLKNQKTRKKKKIMIFGFPIIRLLAYFVIYSVIGFVIETLFGLVTKGVIESRKSFLYGPFCAIYGIGAVVMIVGLQKFKKNNYTLFWGGFLIGSFVEYIISWIGEIVFHVKWWDYSNIPFNLNGRICVWFSLFWGILAIYLMTHIHPKIDRFLDKFSPKIVTIITITFVVVMFLDWCISSFALKMFLTRLVNNYNLELQEISTVQQDKYTKLYENETLRPIIDTFFSDEIMLKTFPNLKVTSKDGEIIWVCDILKDIQPYYFRVFTPNIKK